jgi:hypothetical protein
VTDTNVFQLSQPGTFADPLTEVLRNGARALLAQAVEAEVAALLNRAISSSASAGQRHDLFRARFAYFRAVHLSTKRAVESYLLILDEQKSPPRRDNA